MSDDSAAARTLGDYARVIRRRWVFPALIVPSAVLIAVFAAYLLPASYRAFGTIMLEPSSIPENMVPTTVQGFEDVPASYADQQLELVRNRVMSLDRLQELVAEIDPYPNTGYTPAQKAKLIADNTEIERVDPITLEPLQESMAFSLYYSNPNPHLAKQVADKIVELFITYNQRTRAEQAAAATGFLKEQAKALEASMVKIEGQLAQFKAKYGASLPEAQERNLTGMDRAQRDLEMVEREIRIAQEKESLLALQLAGLSPSLTAPVSDWRMELARLKAELALAQQKYTPEHPDVKRLQRAIADLAKIGSSGDAAAASRPDNPEYLTVQSQHEAARRELEGLRANAARLRADMARYQQHVVTSPDVERQYVQLTRDYQNELARYTDVQAKLKAAALAENLESEARGERFTLIRAPYAPDRPFAPNRLGIILIGIVLGCGLALAAAAVAEASDPTVRSADDLQAILDTTPVGALPMLLNYADRRRRSLVWGSVSAVFVIATIVAAATVVNADVHEQSMTNASEPSSSHGD